MTLQTSTGYLPVEGGKLYYEESGAGHTLVLIHAAVADCTMWDDQFRAFADHYRVIRYDVRGFGRTTTQDVPFSNRQDLYDLLVHLGASSAYVLGLSRGGQIAIDFTLEHPDMVDALIPCSAGISGFMPQPTPEEMAIFSEMEAAEAVGDFVREADLDVRAWADGPGRPAGRVDRRTRDKVRQMCLDNYTNHTVWGHPQLLEPPAIERLPSVSAPTLIIHGDLDFSGVGAAARVLEERIPGAKRVTIPGTAHMVNMEKPEEFNRTVLDFLRAL